MSKPDIAIPTEFATNGIKTDFTTSKILNGFDRINPDVLSGDNLNKFIDDTYKGLNGVLELYDGCVLYDSAVTYNNKSIVFYINSDDEVEIYRSLINNNLNNDLSDETAWEKVKMGDGSSRNIGEIVQSTIPLTDAGLHLLDGTRLSGDGIYKSFVDYMAELYDNPNITSNIQIVGSLTDNNGVLSGFSNNNYATYQNELQSAPYEIVFKIKRSSLTSCPIFELYNSSTRFGLFLTTDNNTLVLLNSNNSNLSGSTILNNLDQWYYIKITYVLNGQLRVYISNTGAFSGEETLDISSNAFDFDISSFDTLEIGHVTHLQLDNPYYRGEIDLKGCYVKANNLIWWNGTTTKGIFIDETSWQRSIAQYGSCGKFVYDSTNNTLRLPRVSDILQGTTDLNALGDLIEAGLPDIQGSFATMTEDTRQTEAFTTGAQIQTQLVDISGSGGWGYPYQVDFAASNSNFIYGNNTTVQPQVVLGLIYIVIATSTKTEIEIDIDEVVTDLNNKADRDLNNSTPTISFATLLNNVGIRTIVETYRSGTSWYRVYSDGWCEQGGIYDNGSNAREIYTSLTFLKPYANVNYIVNILGTREGTGNYKQSTGSTSKTTQGITIGLYGFGSSDYARYIQWRACGYIR